MSELDRFGIPHMLAGSFASTYQGDPRTTNDIDLVIDPSRAAFEAAALIERAGAKLLAPRLCEWRAELAAALGDGEARERLLREAEQLHREIGAPLRAERIARELAP